MSNPRTGIHWVFRIYNIFVLTEDYHWKTNIISVGKDYEFRDKDKNLRMTITKDGYITVKKDYSWDGCTPKFSFWDLLVLGTPDGIRSDKTGKPKAYYASLAHDALYQFLPDLPSDAPLYTRKQADQVFLEILEDVGFVPRRIYYTAVRTFGGLFMTVRKHITRQTESTIHEIPKEKLVKKKKTKKRS